MAQNTWKTMKHDWKCGFLSISDVFFTTSSYLWTVSVRFQFFPRFFYQLIARHLVNFVERLKEKNTEKRRKNCERFDGKITYPEELWICMLFCILSFIILLYFLFCFICLHEKLKVKRYLRNTFFLKRTAKNKKKHGIPFLKSKLF